MLGFFVRHSLCTDWNVELIDSFVLDARSKQEAYSFFKGPFCMDWSHGAPHTFGVPPLSRSFWRKPQPELYFDTAPLLHSEPSRDRDGALLNGCGFKCKGCSWETVFYSSLLTCSIYISDYCMFYLKIFLLRAGLNSVDFNCWVGTLRPGPNLQFLNKCGHSRHRLHLSIYKVACF